jgi:type VI secretion system secreted protein VgrG
MKKAVFVVLLAAAFYFLGYAQAIEKRIEMQALDEIVLKTGSASIIMKKNGSILIEGSDITLKSSGKVNVKSTNDVIIKGSKINGN